MTLTRETQNGADRIKLDTTNRRDVGRIMPTKPLKQCTHSGCRELTAGGKCALHATPWVNKTQVKRITGRRLQKINAMILRSNPICVMCNTKPAIEVDHIIPLAEGGLDTVSNKQGLCNDCHNIKTKQEAERGRKRAMGVD